MFFRLSERRAVKNSLSISGLDSMSAISFADIPVISINTTYNHLLIEHINSV